MTVTLTVTGLPAPQRLDAWLRRAQPTWGRQAVAHLIAARHVRVNDRIVWLASWQVNNGDVVIVTQPPPPKPAPPLPVGPSVAPARFDDAWLLHLDADLVVVNKPAGLLAEAPPYRPDAPNLHTLAQARFGPLTLFHRLDRDTSGVLVLTRTPAANRRLAAAWQARAGTAAAVAKEYLAVVHSPNHLLPAGVIALRLGPDPAHRDRRCVVPRGGDSALTRYQVVAPTHPLPAGPSVAPARQWVRLYPATGRTHQLRVHLAAYDAPILGDRLYGQLDNAPRLMLHALRLSLPAWQGQPAVAFIAPLPDGFDWPAEDAP